MAVDFAKVLEADLSNQDGAKQRKTIAPGFHEALIQSVEQSKFKTGAEGLTLTYMITDGAFSGETIRERIVVKKSDGTDLTWAYAKIKRRLMAGGFTAESLRTFKVPKSDKDLGDYVKLFGKAVKIEVELKKQNGGAYAGTLRPEVTRVEANPKA